MLLNLMLIYSMTTDLDRRSMSIVIRPDTSFSELCNNCNYDHREAFAEATRIWQGIVTGVPGLTGHSLIIRAGLQNMANNQTLGHAGPTQFQTINNFRIPTEGEMFFSAENVREMIRNQSHMSTILHEIGHILGIGTVWRDLGLFEIYEGSPYFIGANAVREYGALLRQNQARIPLENRGGVGTYGVHWAESILGGSPELMMAYANCRQCPISRITIGSLQDIGYQVNYNQARIYPHKLLLSPTIPNRNRVNSIQSSVNSTTRLPQTQRRVLPMRENRINQRRERYEPYPSRGVQQTSQHMFLRKNWFEKLIDDFVNLFRKPRIEYRTYS